MLIPAELVRQRAEKAKRELHHLAMNRQAAADLAAKAASTADDWEAAAASWITAMKDYQAAAARWSKATKGLATALADRHREPQPPAWTAEAAETAVKTAAEEENAAQIALAAAATAMRTAWENTDAAEKA